MESDYAESYEIWNERYNQTKAALEDAEEIVSISFASRVNF